MKYSYVIQIWLLYTCSIPLDSCKYHNIKLLHQSHSAGLMSFAVLDFRQGDGQLVTWSTRRGYFSVTSWWGIYQTFATSYVLM